MKTSDLLKDSAAENQKQLTDWLKKAIILKSGTVSSFCKETGIYSPSQWAGIFAGDKRPGLAEVLAAIDYVGGFVKVGLPDGFIRDIVGESAGDIVPKKRVPVTIDYDRELVVSEKEIQKQKDAEAKAAEKGEKERRKRWHKDRHKILPDPSTNDIKEIHFHLLAMIPVLRDLLGPGTQGIFDLHRDQFGQLAYWITGNGYPHLRIPEDLEQSGQPAFHFNQYVMYSVYKIKPEMVIYANEDQIHYYYNTVFLPQKRVLETMLESGVEIENGYHFFGGKKSIYPKKNHPVPRATQSMPDGFRMLVGTPFKALDHLGWDYENNCATVTPRPITLKWEDAFFSENKEGVYDEKAIDEIE